MNKTTKQKHRIETTKIGNVTTRVTRKFKPAAKSVKKNRERKRSK